MSKQTTLERPICAIVQLRSLMAVIVAAGWIATATGAENTEQAQPAKVDLVKDVGYDVYNFVLTDDRWYQTRVRRQYSQNGVPSEADWTKAIADTIPKSCTAEDIEALHKLKGALATLKAQPTLAEAKEAIKQIDDALTVLNFMINNDNKRLEARAYAYWFAYCYSDNLKIRTLLESEINSICTQLPKPSIKGNCPFNARADLALPPLLALSDYRNDAQKEKLLRANIGKGAPSSKKSYKGIVEQVRPYLEIGRCRQSLETAEKTGDLQKIVVNIDKAIKQLTKWGPVANDPNCGFRRLNDLRNRWFTEKFLTELKLGVLRDAYESSQNDAKRKFLQTNIKNTEQKLKRYIDNPPE